MILKGGLKKSSFLCLLCSVPYVPVYQIQNEDFESLANQHPVEEELVASLRTRNVWMNNCLIQKADVFIDQKREYTPGDEEEEAHSKVEDCVKSFSFQDFPEEGATR